MRKQRPPSAPLFSRLNLDVIGILIVVMLMIGAAGITLGVVLNHNAVQRLHTQVGVAVARDCEATRIENGTIIKLLNPKASYYPNVASALHSANDKVCHLPH